MCASNLSAVFPYHIPTTCFHFTGPDEPESYPGVSASCVVKPQDSCTLHFNSICPTYNPLLMFG